MKKIAELIIICFLLSTNLIFAKAVQDITPPTIQSITLSNNLVMGGDSIQYTMVGQDDLSGIRTYMLEYRSLADNSKFFSVQIYNDGITNTFTGTYALPKTTTPGMWKADVIQIWDVSNNRRVYYRSSSDDNLIVNFSALDIEIKADPSIDLVFPVLNSISVNPQELSAPGSFTVSVNASDNISENLTASIFMTGINTGTMLTKVSNNNYTATFTISESDKFKQIKVDYVSLKDDAGNTVFYSNNVSNYSSQFESRLLDRIIGITIVNSAVDTVPPVLHSYSYGASTIAIPGVFKATFDITDDISGYGFASIGLVELKDDGSRILNYLMGINYDPITKKYSTELPFNQYSGVKKFYIGYIELHDNAGNISTYSTNSSDPVYKIEEKVFSLVQGTPTDLTTGTMKDDYVSEIKEIVDNSVVSIDSTKNSIVKAAVFEAIRNTNKKIIINNNGIEWVFNGADITNPSKDIDTNITISTFIESGNTINIENYISGGNGLIIEFASNGLLPGKALVKIKADYTLRNYVGDKNLYVYYYNQTVNGLGSVKNLV